jgi:hypothetical protein
MAQGTAGRGLDRLALTVVTLMFAALPLAAQVAVGAVGAIEGVVRGPDGKPIADVEIATPFLPRVIRSDSVGEFLLAGLPAGPVELRFRRLAYSPAIVSIDVEPRDTISIVVTLTVVALQLNAVVVNEDAARIRIMRAFEERRKHGFGHFITREEIEKRGPRMLSDMVRRVPGTVLTPVSGGSRYVLRFSRAVTGPGRSCEPQYWVDGIFVQAFNIDDILPSDVEGVELYGGPSVAPPQFANPRANPSCGSVVIWTRVP